MEHQVKIVIGANYGDEGKGLMSRYFTKEFLKAGKKPVTVFYNGSAQRGHTADYEDGTRHVFHNFCAGAKEGGITYYSSTFLPHPMDFCRELDELGYVPTVYCDKDCVIVTPLDLLADHIILDSIELKHGREFGSCGYGTWSATDRIKAHPEIAYTLSDFTRGGYWLKMHKMIPWLWERLERFEVDLQKMPFWNRYLDKSADAHGLKPVLVHFERDLQRFFEVTRGTDFEHIWDGYDSFVFEGAQGLLLDKDLPDPWTTTSNTGLKNPLNILSPYSDYEAEVCYVTRPYITRHGSGPLPGETWNAAWMEDIICDATNIYNSFQGNLRFAKMDWKEFDKRIAEDFKPAEPLHFRSTIALTHCNEVLTQGCGATYISDSPCKVRKASYA